MKTPQNDNFNSLNIVLSAQNELSLYIHIPFCREKCSYCNFYSLPITVQLKNTHSIEKTCERIFLEIDEVNANYKKCYKTVFIGGGNPGILSKDLLEKLLLKVTANGMPQEVTLECNPENIDNALISFFQRGLVTRLSTGIQSLSEKLLIKIGRNCTDTAAVRRVLRNKNLISREWILNVDLIVGIPGQTFKDVKSDIDEIIDLVHPEHLSIYDLTYEPETPLYNQFKNQLATLQENCEEMLPIIWNYLQEIGYHQYEISNFARKTENGVNFCKHNLQYWEMKPYIGIGPGAASTVFNGNTVLRIECNPDLMKYQSRTSPPFNDDYQIEILNNQEYLREKLIMGLRLFSGINLVQFENIFGIGLQELIPHTVENLLKRKLMIIQNNFLKFTENGIMLMNSLLVEMFVEIDTYFSSHRVSNCLDLTAVFEL